MCAATMTFIAKILHTHLRTFPLAIVVAISQDRSLAYLYLSIAYTYLSTVLYCLSSLSIRGSALTLFEALRPAFSSHFPRALLPPPISLHFPLSSLFGKHIRAPPPLVFSHECIAGSYSFPFGIIIYNLVDFRIFILKFSLSLITGYIKAF